MSWARCSECDRTFGSDTGFERHQIRTTGQPGYGPDYDWRCATPEEMEVRGLHRDAKGWWRGNRHSAPPVSPRTDSDTTLHEQAEAYDRHRAFISWAEQDRREESRYADEEPRP